jgi:hypothetical protein
MRILQHLKQLLRAQLPVFSLTVVTLIANVAYAAPIDGVRCPIGYEANYDTTQNVMRCERQSVHIRPAICDPSSPEHLIYRMTKGKDYCVKRADADVLFPSFLQSDQRRRAVTCAADSSGGRWHVEVDDSGERDRCKSVRSEWIYPSQQ